MRWKMLLLAMLPVFATVGESYADDFYKGKTIRVIVGGSAGGGFDIYTRAMARHMGKHIPGNPSLLVENMTGAGTLIAAKFLHSSAKPDGLAFGIFNGALILSGALGNKSVDFDMRELEYLGVPIQDNNVCAVRKESGVTNMDQWFASKTPIKLGGLSPGNSTSDVPRILAAALNLPIQLAEQHESAPVDGRGDVNQIGASDVGVDGRRAALVNVHLSGKQRLGRCGGAQRAEIDGQPSFGEIACFVSQQHRKVERTCRCNRHFELVSFRLQIAALPGRGEASQARQRQDGYQTVEENVCLLAGHENSDRENCFIWASVCSQVWSLSPAAAGKDHRRFF